MRLITTALAAALTVNEQRPNSLEGYTLLAKALMKACEFGPGDSYFQPNIDKCVSLYYGLTEPAPEWGRVPAFALNYYKGDARRI